MAELYSDQIVSHYRLVEKIGEGAMGVVWRACNTRLECDVALKFLRPDRPQDDAAHRRMQKEARALSRIHHPNVAVVHDLDKHEEIDFLVMEYVPGVNLEEHLRAGPLGEREIAGLGRQLAAGLHAAHTEGVIHHDLKPGNVRIDPHGGLKILDFGLARLTARPTDMTASTAQSCGPAGTLAYMCPEILRGDPGNVRTDIYAAGIVLYEMATGRLPFAAATNAALVDAILHAEPAPPTLMRQGLSPVLESVILKAIDREPDLRYQSAQELEIDLARLGRSDGVILSQPPQRRTRYRVRVVLSGSVLLALATLWHPTQQAPNTAHASGALTTLVDWPAAGLDPQITPDGQSASFIANRGDGARIWVRAMQGGAPHAIASIAGNPTSHVWSPDGTQVAVLVVLEDRAVFVQRFSSSGGPVLESRRLDPSFVDARLVRWCTSQIYVADGRSGLWSLSSDGGAPRLRIATGRVRKDFDVSQDERGVVFTKFVNQAWQIWKSDVDGNQEHPVAVEPGEWGNAKWRGDVCRSIVASHVSDGQWDVWEIDIRSGHSQRLTFSVESEFVESVSRDGSVIALQQIERRSDLVQIDPRTEPADEQRLTVENAQALWPSASLTGERIAFQKAPVYDPGSFLLESEIWTADFAGTRLRNLNVVAVSGGLARLSADAVFLAYLRRGVSGAGAHELWLVNLQSQHTWCMSRQASVPRFYQMPLDRVQSTFEWSCRGQQLFWVEEHTPEGARVCIASFPATAIDTMVTSGPGTRISDVHPSESAQQVAYVLTGGDADAGPALWVHDRVRGVGRVLVESTVAWPGDVYCSGWIDVRTVLAMRTVLQPDWSERVQVLVARLDGSTRVVAVLDRAFGGISRFDVRTSTLYMLATDPEFEAPNLFALHLPDGACRRLTDNRLPTASYSALELLPNGNLLCTLQERRESVWFFRYGV